MFDQHLRVRRHGKMWKIMNLLCNEYFSVGHFITFATIRVFAATSWIHASCTYESTYPIKASLAISFKTKVQNFTTMKINMTAFKIACQRWMKLQMLKYASAPEYFTQSAIDLLAIRINYKYAVLCTFYYLLTINDTGRCDKWDREHLWVVEHSGISGIRK